MRFETSEVGEALSLCVHDFRNALAALQSELAFLSSVVGPEAPESGSRADLGPEPETEAGDTGTGASSALSAESLVDLTCTADTFGHIIENLGVLSAALRAAPVPRAESLAAATLVEGVCGALARTARSHGVGLELGENSPSVLVRAPREPLQRALTNLVRNVIEHSPEGAVVRVEVRPLAGEAVFAVHDAHARPRPDSRLELFTLAGQLAAKHSHFRYGRGLGLFCAALAAERAGATVAFVEEPPSRFELRLPLATPSSVSAAERPLP